MPSLEDYERRKKWDRFVHNVSVAGLLELYQAPNHVIRLLWTTTLLLAAVSIVFHVWLLVIDYIGKGDTFTIDVTNRAVIPFPNVTACAPVGGNKTMIREYLRYPPQIQKKLQMMNAEEREKFISQAVLASMYSMDAIDGIAYDLNSPVFRDLKDVITASINAYDGPITDLYYDALPTCSQTIFNCFFNNKPYACCDGHVFNLLDHNACFELPLEQFDLSLDRHRCNFHPPTFQFDITMDWEYIPFFSNDAVDGFSLHLADPASVLGSPIALPAGMHAFVEMSRPMKRLDYKRCYQPEEAPVLEYIGHYDAKAYRCRAKRYLRDFMMKSLGCSLPSVSFRPPANETCDGQQAFVLKSILATGLESMDVDHRMNNHVRDQMRSLFYHDDVCLPLCESWEYMPRHSYSVLEPNSDLNEEDTGRISRSRITVTVGSEYYEERAEKPPHSFYSTFVSIGYMLSLYAGASVISLFEVLYYLFELWHRLWKDRNKHRVRVLVPVSGKLGTVVCSTGLES